jgi:hypothetical protein
MNVVEIDNAPEGRRQRVGRLRHCRRTVGCTLRVGRRLADLARPHS